MWRFADFAPTPAHVITRATRWIDDDAGEAALWGRIRCQGCQRTQLVPLPAGCTYVGAEFLTDAAARLLHTCGCGGKPVTFTPA